MNYPEQFAADRYRIGYREGFNDGFVKGAEHKERHKPARGLDSAGENDADREKDAESEHNKDESDKREKSDKREESDKNDAKPPLYKRPLVVGIVLLVLLALIIAAIVFWRISKSHESTDDAFIDGLTSQVAAQTSGRVAKLYVTDNQHVKKGDPLLDIDSRDVDARIEQSRAQLATAEGQFQQANAQISVRRASAAEAEAAVRQSEAELTKAAQDLARYRSVDPQAVPRQAVDAAQSTERAARARLDAARMSARAAQAQVQANLAEARSGRAQVEAARAAVDAATLQGSYTHVVAPMAGRVAQRAVEPGNVIATGQALMAIVSESLWVTANFKETQLTQMKPGLAATIVVDAYPDVTFRGHVDSIQRATGSYFSALPAQNATGNYVKVVQRVPVKIVFDDDRIDNYIIGPGMSVVPTVSLP